MKQKELEEHESFLLDYSKRFGIRFRIGYEKGYSIEVINQVQLIKASADASA